MINLNGIFIENPFVMASGPIKYGLGYNFYENPVSWTMNKSGLLKPELFGAVITKTITFKPHVGNYRWYAPWKVMRPLRNGWINRVGWTNCGIEEFIEKIYPEIKLKNLVVSIGALINADEFLQMIDRLNVLDILAVELNLSCTNVEITFRDDLKALSKLFKEATAHSHHPLIVKLGPDEDVITKARIVEDAGINALSLINTLPADLPGFGHGGISGPRIKNIALKVVSDVSNFVSIPIIGGGGINNRTDCDEFFSAGATAVSFGSLFILHPLQPQKIVQQFCCDHHKTR